MSGRVIVVGSVNIDLVARVPALPHPGETVTGGSYERHNGGKGGNQAVAAARLRRPTLFIGALGDDTFEVEARRALSSERVDVSMLARLRGQATGVALILVDAAGENEIAVVPGANGAVEPGYVRDCLARLGPLGGDVLLVCNEVPIDVVREALTCANAAGATTILNPAPATGIDRSTFGLADIVAPNVNELATLLATDRGETGKRLDGGDVGVQARALLSPGAHGQAVRKAVIVTLGARGVVVLERLNSGLGKRPAPRLAATLAATEPPASDEERDERGDGAAEARSALAQSGLGPSPAASGPTPVTIRPAAAGLAPAVSSGATAEPAASEEPEPLPPGAEVVGDLRIWPVPANRVATLDTTGAGDAFCGALAAALAEGRPLPEAVERAVAGGALATTRVGAREGMPTAAELEGFLAERSASTPS